LVLSLCAYWCREGIANDNLDEVEARYVHPKLREAMMKETSCVQKLVPKDAVQTEEVAGLRDGSSSQPVESELFEADFVPSRVGPLGKL
jgi:hypothetical protein